jgi:hypothetical protein
LLPPRQAAGGRPTVPVLDRWSTRPPARPATTSEREAGSKCPMAELGGAVRCRCHDPDRGSVVIVLLCQDMAAAALLAAERPLASASAYARHCQYVLSSHYSVVVSSHKRNLQLYVMCARSDDGPVHVYVPAVGELPVAEEAPVQERAGGRRRHRRRRCTGRRRRGRAAEGSGGGAALVDDVVLGGGEEGTSGLACDLRWCS